MKRILLLIFVLISLNAFSQLQVKEGSFKYVPGGVIDDKEEYTDGNDLPMALIKISTENIPEQERMRLVFVGNRATQIIKKPRTGSMWIYISAEPATFIDIRHPDYGTYKYLLPEELCDYCVYEMVLQYVNNNSSNTYISVDSEPSGADIYIDGKHYGQTPNIITDLPMGKHEIKLEKQEYNPVTKIFIIEDGEKLKFNETLLSVYYKASAVEEEEKEVVNTSDTDTDGNEVFNVNEEADGTFADVTLGQVKDKTIRESNPQRKGFFVIPEVGIGVGTCVGLLGLQGVWGYEFNNHFAFGIGTGIVGDFVNYLNIPLYVSLRGDITKKQIANGGIPYYSLDFGYNIKLTTFNAYWEKFYNKGILFSPEIGIRNNKLYIGTELMITPYHLYYWGGGVNQEIQYYHKHTNLVFSLKLGYRIPFKQH